MDAREPFHITMGQCECKPAKSNGTDDLQTRCAHNDQHRCLSSAWSRRHKPPSLGEVHSPAPAWVHGITRRVLIRDARMTTQGTNTHTQRRALTTYAVRDNTTSTISYAENTSTQRNAMCGYIQAVDAILISTHSLLLQFLQSMAWSPNLKHTQRQREQTCVLSQLLDCVCTCIY